MVADRLGHRRGIGMIDEVVADLGDRCGVTMAHAGSAHDAHLGADCRLQVSDQLFGAGEVARQVLADADRDGRRWRLAFLHHVEMGVEGRDLVDLGLRHVQLFGQGGEMSGRQMAVLVLDQVQEFDQQIAPPLGISQQGADLGLRRRLDLPALGHGASPAPT